MSIDYREYPVLYVDDEKANLVAIRYALEDEFTVLTATSGDEALQILAARDIGVLLCDQRMPGMSGVEVCERARSIQPDAVRIILTAYADLHACIEAVNRGQVSRYLAKPIRNEDLIEALRTSIGFLHLERTMRDLQLRLLRTGQHTAVVTLQAQMGHELGNLAHMLLNEVQAMGDLLVAVRQPVAAGDQARAEEALDELTELHHDVSTVIERLQGVIGWMKKGIATGSEPPPRPQCEVARVVEATVRIVRAHLQQVARLDVRIEAEPRVSIGTTELGQVVMNLLLNAAEAVTDPVADRISILVATDADQAVIQVDDTGPGIPDAIADRIFDPRFTTKPRGGGLGLSVVRRCVEDVGGQVTAGRADSGGASFRVVLPLLPAL